MSLQEIYENHIEDIYFYDDGTSSTKSSNYDLANAFGMEGKSKGTLSITNDGDKYHISNSNNNYKAIPISLLSSVKVPFKLSCKITNNDIGLYAENGAVQFLNKVSNYVRIVDSHKTQTSWNPSERIDGIGSDTEYTLELTANNGTLTYKIFDGTTEIYSRTKTSSTYNNTSNNVNFGLIMERYGITFKEVMIELL